MKIRPFNPHPESHYCQVENALLDIIMPTCTPAEFMILMFIFRKTIGFHRDEDQLSYAQIKKGTSIRSKATINKALDGLEEKNYIARRGVERGSIWYSINCDLEIDIETGSEIEPDDLQSGSENAPDKQSGNVELVQKLNQTGSEIEPVSPHLVQKLNPPKDNLFKNTFKNTSSTTAVTDFNSPDLIPEFPPLDPDLAECQSLYKNNVGPLGPIQLEDFKTLYDGLSPPPGETRQDWFEYAVLEATSNGINNWKYCRAIVENIGKSGSLQKHKEQYNGSTNNGHRTGAGHSGSETPKGKSNVSGRATGGSRYDQYIKTNQANIDAFEAKMRR